MSKTGRFTELVHYPIDPANASLLPVEFCLERLVVILGEANTHAPLTLGMVDPHDRELRTEVEERLGRTLEPVQLNDYEIRKALAHLHGVTTGERGIAVKLSSNRRIEFGTEQLASKLVDDMLSVAIRSGATDLHVEVYKEDVDLRFRIDGFLRQITTPLAPPNVSRVVSRIKVLASLDPVDRRHPQDGHFTALYEDPSGHRRIDFRVATVPGPFGEDVVVRVLDPNAFHLDLDDLGIEGELLARYKRLVNYPNGLILVTGPTVSGKTNTLYATIHSLREKSVKIVTVEEPIEYEFPKINQKEVSRELGFADYVRAFLRQNADVMLVGEIRDAETADVVIQAATTGHMVLSSVHTRDALGAITRLRALGIQDDSIASTLVAVIGQRLLGRICPDCKEEVTPPADLVSLYYSKPPEHPFRKGRGCESCDGTGYSGLVAVFELLEVSRKVASALGEGMPMEAIHRLAREEGYASMVDDALRRVEAGETTLEEVARRTMPPIFRSS